MGHGICLYLPRSRALLIADLIYRGLIFNCFWCQECLLLFLFVRAQQSSVNQVCAIKIDGAESPWYLILLILDLSDGFLLRKILLNELTKFLKTTIDERLLTEGIATFKNFFS